MMYLILLTLSTLVPLMVSVGCWVLGVVDSKEVNNLLDLAGIQQGAAVSVPCGRRLTYTL